jgi:hypothetical protein
LIIKVHLSGVAIAYEPSKRATPSLLPKIPSRPNGSLYNRQKRKIADCTEWLRINQRKDRKAMIFCLTSPGFINLANSPKFVSRFVDNMKANYGMENYVWVREFTKLGYPHFHFIAHWNKPTWFFDCSDCGSTMKDKECTQCYCKLSRINKISLYWSSLFGSDSINSIRLGSYHPITKKRSYFVVSQRQCRYLTKYIGKNLGEEHFIMDGESNCIIYPTYKSRTRKFGMSEDVAMFSEPSLFESQMYITETRTVLKADGSYADIPSMNRTFIGESGQIDEVDLKRYAWRWTGHGQTFVGVAKYKDKELA